MANDPRNVDPMAVLGARPVKVTPIAPKITPIGAQPAAKAPVAGPAVAPAPVAPVSAPVWMTFFSNEKKVYDKMLWMGVPQDVAVQKLKDKRKELMGGDTRLTDKETAEMKKMQAEGVSSKDAVSKVLSARSSAEPLWKKVGRGTVDVMAGNLQTIANYGGNVLDFATLWQQGYGKEVKSMMDENVKNYGGNAAFAVGSYLPDVAMAAVPVGGVVTWAKAATAAGRALQFGKAVGTTATIGAGFGAVTPILQKGSEATVGDVAGSAAVGAVTWAALHAATSGAIGAYKWAKGLFATKEAGQLANEAVDAFRGGIRPQSRGKKPLDSSAIQRETDSIKAGGDALVRHIDEIGAPTPKTLNEAVDALSEAKKAAAAKYSMAGVKVETTAAKKVADAMRSRLSDASKRGLGKDYEKAIAELDAVGGTQTLDQAEDFLANLNKKVSSAYKTGDFTGVEALEAARAAFRQELLNDVNAMSGKGAEYAQLRKDWGAMHQLQAQVDRQARLQAGKAAVGLTDQLANLGTANAIVDVFTTGGAASAMKAAGLQSVKFYAKWMNSPERGLRNFLDKMRQARAKGYGADIITEDVAARVNEWAQAQQLAASEAAKAEQVAASSKAVTGMAESGPSPVPNVAGEITSPRGATPVTAAPAGKQGAIMGEQKLLPPGRKTSSAYVENSPLANAAIPDDIKSLPELKALAKELSSPNHPFGNLPYNKNRLAKVNARIEELSKAAPEKGIVDMTIDELKARERSLKASPQLPYNVAELAKVREQIKNMGGKPSAPAVEVSPVDKLAPKRTVNSSGKPIRSAYKAGEATKAPTVAKAVEKPATAKKVTEAAPVEAKVATTEPFKGKFQENMTIVRPKGSKNVGKDTLNPGNITADSVPAGETKASYGKKIGAKGTYLSKNGREYFVFPTEEAGFAAMKRDISMKQAGKTQVKSLQNANATLKDYLRAHVGSDVTGTSYAKAVLKETGAGMDTPFRSVDTDALARGIAKAEGYGPKKGFSKADVSPVGGKGFDMTPEDAVFTYTDHKYKAINSELRAGKESPMTNLIDEAIGKNSLQEDTTLYRGVDKNNLANLIKKWQGKTISDPAFLSTSTSKEVAKTFSDGYLLEIKAKKGVKYAENPSSNKEAEILLGRNSKLEIVGKRKEGEYTIISAEISPVGGKNLTTEAKKGSMGDMNTQSKKYATAMDFIESPEYKAKMDAINARKKATNWKVTKTSSNLYHTTPAVNLESIAKNGLTIGNKPRFEGVSWKGNLSFSANEEAASYYGGASDVMIRTKRGYSPKSLESDLLAWSEGVYISKEGVPPEFLEVKVKGKWVPIEDAAKANQKVSPIGGKKVVEAIRDEVKKYWDKNLFKENLIFRGETGTWRGYKIDAKTGLPTTVGWYPGLPTTADFNMAKNRFASDKLASSPTEVRGFVMKKNAKILSDPKEIERVLGIGKKTKEYYDINSGMKRSGPWAWRSSIEKIKEFDIDNKQDMMKIRKAWYDIVDTRKLSDYIQSLPESERAKHTYLKQEQELRILNPDAVIEIPWNLKSMTKEEIFNSIK